ncbi:hypothetical protein [Atlantibacter hermannii]|uniref:hypothetical protein n=1 Tax=Atlantibacter hermannii TaxID=565 RepID=UPI0028A92756|nr:hypothetical protein [Atlantibacter hermannii]
MTDNNKTLVSAGHELASELKADCGAVDMRSVANLLTELASALDVQSARSDALAAKLNLVNNLMTVAEQVNKLAQESAEALVKERDGLAVENAELKVSAISLADEAAQIYKRWNLTQQPDGDIVDMQTIHETICACHDTPNTDAWVNEQRAAGRVEGVNFAAARLAAAFNNGFIDKPTAEVYDVVKAVLGAKEELATAPDDGLSGEYAEQALNDWAAQLRGSQV